jgi:hypothetical protein
MPNVRVLGVSVNPGPFSIKEHVLVTIMATVGGYCACFDRVVSALRLTKSVQLPMLYASQLRTCQKALTCCRFQTDIIAVQRVYYGQTYSFVCESLSKCCEPH